MKEAYVTHYQTATHKYGNAITKCGKGAKGPTGKAQHLILATSNWEEVTCARCIAARNVKALKGEATVTLTAEQIVKAQVLAQRIEATDTDEAYDYGLLASDLKRLLKKMVSEKIEEVQVAYKPAKLKMIHTLLLDWPTA